MLTISSDDYKDCYTLFKNFVICVFLAFVRNDALPLGSFSKYTWHITNLMHVKRIFDTPEVCTCLLPDVSDLH